MFGGHRTGEKRLRKTPTLKGAIAKDKLDLNALRINNKELVPSPIEMEANSNLQDLTESWLVNPHLEGPEGHR